MGPAPDPAPALALWQLSAPGLVAETPRACIWQVTRPDGQRAALKLLRPGETEEARGASYLAALDGQGAVRVLGRNGPAILMEWCDGPSLGDLVRAGQDIEATGHLCDTVQRLHAVPIDPAPLEALASRFAPLTRAAQTRDLAAAADLARALLSTAGRAIALHGDLHHDNILSSPRGWLAIDPKGVHGDPAYEPANAFRNPDGAGGLIFDPARIARLAEEFSARLGHPRDRLLGWAAAQCALSVVWSTEAGQDTGADLRLIPHLLRAASGARR